ncbi:MAG: hypothetical protein K8W52_09095 [Deltaproteobacteria bacterium]|nr:hypothetical protein [Deltaproteobacteria bacterium]
MDFDALLAAIDALRARALAARADHAPALAAVAPSLLPSARNLVAYLALRAEDLRPLQQALAAHGLSSLGRIEGHVLDALDQVRARIDDARVRRGALAAAPAIATLTPSRDEAAHLLETHTRALLGPRPAHRDVCVMVTAPAAAQVDAAWADRALGAGTDILRVNGAHEDPAAWGRIVETVRAAAARAGRTCRVVVDLPGPKLRTVARHEGPRVVRWRPAKDHLGQVQVPCRVALYPRMHAAPAGPALAIPTALWPLRRGDELRVRDARGRKRRLRVLDAQVAIVDRTVYLTPDCSVAAHRDGERLGRWTAEVPAQPFALRIEPGDRFRLLRAGARPVDDRAIGCSLDLAVAALRPGQRVIFDDGMLETVVEAIDGDGASLVALRLAGASFALRAEKGINLPDTVLDVPALGPDDERALAFAVAHADVVEASFVRSPDDVRALHARLAELGGDALGIVLKIETGEAFAQLPALLLAAMARPPVGVMIARGDLAVEIGFERLAEVQEEILWLCEAAHVPVIWATQVLETLARTGQPSRAEVTDAAMAGRAECVMLNKGPFVADAVAVLDDILRRMAAHQHKKRSLFRRLSVAHAPH